MEQPLVFVNVGWMVSYQGVNNDPTLGGHGWLKNHDYGHEAWNFLSVKGELYGYVPRSARINLKRLGANSKDEMIAGVTVVWIARNPRDGGTYIAGWYRNALIHKESNHLKVARSSKQVVEYQIQAPASEARLLNPDQRILRVPTAKVKGNLGQSPVWYGNPDFLMRVREYLENDGVIDNRREKGGSKAPRNQDPEMRKLVELAAVRHAIAYYTSQAGGSHTVKSVELDNVGWDLTVIGGDVTLKVEVKGLSGSNLCVELTPNEYRKMSSPEHRNMYVVYVVTNALTPYAKSNVFYYNSDASHGRVHVWATEDGQLLNIEEFVGARLTIA